MLLEHNAPSLAPATTTSESSAQRRAPRSDALAESDLDLTNSRSEADLMRIIAERLHRAPTTQDHQDRRV